MKNLFCLALSVFLLIGCTSPSSIDQAQLLGNKKFTKEIWLAANQEQRGEMVASLLRQLDLSKLSASQLRQLLGPPTGYYDYDENLAYFVGPKSVESQYGKGYLMVFVTDKATGRILSSEIIPKPKKSH